LGFGPGRDRAAAAADDGGSTIAREFRETHRARILGNYAELLAIPNVASDTVNIRHNAERLRGALAARGVEAELWTLPDAPPIVFVRLDGTSGSPTSSREST
jgi:hypothetical protein